MRYDAYQILVCLQIYLHDICRVLAFNALPRYRENVYDPDPDKSFTKEKLNRVENKENTAPNVADVTNLSNNDSIVFPPDESTSFNNDYTVLQNFVPMDAFQHLKKQVEVFVKI